MDFIELLAKLAIVWVICGPINYIIITLFSKCTSEDRDLFVALGPFGLVGLVLALLGTVISRAFMKLSKFLGELVIETVSKLRNRS